MEKNSTNPSKMVDKDDSFLISRTTLIESLKTNALTVQKLDKVIKTPGPEVEKTENLDPGAIKTIETRLQLTFLLDKAADSYVCMANSPEVRDDFKDVFDYKDLIDYILGIAITDFKVKVDPNSKTEFLKIPYPKTAADFWQSVRLGSNARDSGELKTILKEQLNKQDDDHS